MKTKCLDVEGKRDDILSECQAKNPPPGLKCEINTGSIVRQGL